MLGLLKEVDFESFTKLYETKGFYGLLDETKEFNNYRSYFGINQYGDIKIKPFNKSLVNLTYFGEEALKEYFYEGLFIKERKKIDKIDRLSAYKIEDLEKNLYKIFYNRDLSFALRYSKEFILKDKNLFVTKLAHFVLLDRVINEKALITLALIKALENVDKNNIDGILHSYLPYIATFPTVIDETLLKENCDIDKEKLDLVSVAYLNLMPYGYEEKKSVYFGKLWEYFINIKETTKEDSKLFERLSENVNELYKMWK